MYQVWILDLHDICFCLDLEGRYKIKVDIYAHKYDNWFLL